MYCRHCGVKLDEEAKFCPNCGSRVENDAHTSSAATDATEVIYNKEEDRPPKVWTIFAIISKIIGIVCLATSWVPFFNYASLSFGVVGIVMACLGRKAKNAEADNNCRLGLRLSIAAVAVSVTLIFVYHATFIAALLSQSV